MKVDELVEAFKELSEDDQLAMVKKIMPSVCGMFQKNPQKMMAEMMPLCSDMMQGCGMDMGKMMNMMGTMGMKP